MPSSRERLGALLLPLARRVPVSPTTITVTGIGLCVTAAAMLAMAAADPRLFLLAPLLALLGGLCDALDGVVARLRGQCSQWGDFVDHLGDRISDGAMFAGWLVGSGVRPVIGLAALFGVLLTGYAGTQIEATFGARSYQDLGRGEFIGAMILLPAVSWAWATGRIADRVLSLSPPEWLALAVLAATLHALAQRLRRAYRLAGEVK